MYGINKVEDLFSQLQEGMVKYKDYKMGTPSQMKFRDPETPELRERAKQLSNSSLLLSILVPLGFVAMLIAAIACNMGIKAILICAGLCVVVIPIALGDRFKKLQIMTGKAVFKQEVRKNNDGHYHTKYFISVIPDTGEKIVFTRLQVSRDDYEKITEGTPVMVVNRFNRAGVI